MGCVFSYFADNKSEKPVHLPAPTRSEIFMETNTFKDLKKRADALNCHISVYDQKWQLSYRSHNKLTGVNFEIDEKGDGEEDYIVERIEGFLKEIERRY